MALAVMTEELYGNRVQINVSGRVEEYGTGTGVKAAATARRFARQQGASKLRRKSHGITWEGKSFTERFTYVVLG